jgi:hypothetical protein
MNSLHFKPKLIPVPITLPEVTRIRRSSMFRSTSVSAIRIMLPIGLILLTAAAHGQFYKLNGATISVGAMSPFDRSLQSNPTSGSYVISTPTGGVINTNVSGQRQFTTDSVGFLTSLQFHPRPWAGVELNYSYSHYSERYAFNYSAATTSQTASAPTVAHEATAAYEFHPRHIPFQPFVNVGGGSIDFLPLSGPNQWRGAGLLEAGFDLPTHNPHLGFRIEGRSLYYRAPNFNNPAISTRTWRVTVEPAVSTYFRF